ncbi:transposase [Mesorhizobium sp. M0496]|uniref:transposase n=1 Tax=Mesorhizobium sp. M0496 TaxID=2956952 RepID=UPI003334B371
MRHSANGRRRPSSPGCDATILSRRGSSTHPMNAAIFERYVETQLAPELSPGDVVILDDVGFHRNERAAQLVRQRGAWLLFLPPYSPDLNPCIDGSCGSRVSDRVW